MQSEKLLIVDFLQKVLSENLFKGRQMYYPTTDFTTSNGDESSITILNYSQNAPTPDDDDETELHYKTDDQIARSINALQIPQYTATIPTNGLTNEYKSPANDYIRIQFTDHSIIIILIASGQY